MSNRRVKSRLRKARREQEALEEELGKLNTSEDPEKVCHEIIEFVQRNEEPMHEEENPFAQCFVAGTLVRMADGQQKPIEELQPGEAVQCASLDADERVLRAGGGDEPLTGTILRCTRAAVRETVRVETDLPLHESSGDEALVVVECTSEHPFWVPGQGGEVSAELFIVT